MAHPPSAPSPRPYTQLRLVSLAAGDFAAVLWLWHARCSFIGAPFRWPGGIGIAAVAAVVAWTAGSAVAAEGGVAHRLLPCLAAGLSLAAAVGGAEAAHLLIAGARAALWFGVAGGLVTAAFHLGFDAARTAWPDRPGEFGRWLIVGAGAVAITLPFYRRGALGSGDAYWYVIMLADFVAQIRHGIFPVWVGQSEFAYNGAVVPLRVAPWFQHMGGLLDLLTARSLEPTALKNALLCVNSLAIAAAAYGCLRSVLTTKPGAATLLALLWIFCPGVVAPLYLGDQYMTFMAMPFLPVVVAGCWRLWDRDDPAARLLIVIGLAGLWLSHTPIALWGSLLAAGIYAGHLAARRAWRAELRRLAWMTALFLSLGSLPVASALTIDNPSRTPSNGGAAWEQIKEAFPKSLLPIRSEDLGLHTYQLGYSLIAAGLAALVLIAWRRPRSAAPLATAVLAIGLFAVPVPGITRWIWMHLPALFITINNIWPMQRLYSIWGAVVVFTFAALLADGRILATTRRAVAILVLLGVGSLWSAFQASRIIAPIFGTMSDEAETELPLRPENLRLTRYAYTSFAEVPEYFSHGYTDPLLENRLLTRNTLAVMTADADAAAPRLAPDSETATVPRLLQSGAWKGSSDNHSGIYILKPSLAALQPGRRYALRLEFPSPPSGLLQITARGLFREYILPDSGVGLAMTGPSLSFGALPESGRVIPLLFRAAGPQTPLARFYPGKYRGETLDFGRFWLFSYDQEDLPIRVRSWLPYRAETETAVPAYLETPRIWQRGWKAEVNGRPVPVLASPHHLAMIPIEPGSSRVTLFFRAPAWLTLLFWVHAVGWTAVAVAAFAAVLRRAVRLP